MQDRFQQPHDLLPFLPRMRDEKGLADGGEFQANIVGFELQNSR
jgi:hypothetical protein